MTPSKQLSGASMTNGSGWQEEKEQLLLDIECYRSLEAIHTLADVAINLVNRLYEQPKPPIEGA